MIKIIKRRDYGQGAGSEEAKLSDEELALDRLVYRKLSSWTENKVITTPDGPDTDFHRFLLDMDNLWIYKYYPTLHTGPIPTPDLIALDEYLGTLGLTQDYPFKDDTYNTINWGITKEDSAEIRVLVDTTDNTVLMDTTDNTILVRYI